MFLQGSAAAGSNAKVILADARRHGKDMQSQVCRRGHWIQILEVRPVFQPEKITHQLEITKKKNFFVTEMRCRKK